ncbi:MAG TPA: TRAP transporter small permease [Azospirillum sp.]
MPPPPAAPVTGAAAVPAIPLSRRLIRPVDWLNEALLVALALALGALACLGFAQVVARYAFQQPLTWSEEVIRYALIWMVFLGIGVGVRKGMLASVEIVTQMAPAPLARVLAWVVLLVSAVFWLVLLVYGIAILENVEGMNSGALEMPMSAVYLAVPVGAALALLNTIVAAIDPPAPSLEGAIE